jgi:hypothetical protein
MSPEKREKLFNQGRQLHWALGNLFQNPMEITPADVRMEEEVVERIIEEINLYKAELTKLNKEMESPDV